MSLINIVPTSPIVNIDVSDVSKVVLLPAASTCVGTTYNIRDWKAACSLINRIYLSTVGLDRVDGASLSTTQLQMTSSLEIVKIMSLGNTAWSILSRNKTVASTLGISIRPYIPIASPLLVFGSFSFDVTGTVGGSPAKPKLTWSNSGGAIASYTLNLLSGSTAALGTSLSLTPPAAGDTSYTYTGATTTDTYYSFLLVATNSRNSSTLSQPTAIRNRAAPVITLTSFTFGGTAGSTSAAPTLVWSSTGGAVESYALVVYGDANSTPTTVLSSTPPASGDLSYAYPGSTVASFYYKMVLTATNVTSPTSVITTSVILNLSPPSLSEISFAFAGTLGSINANPTLTWSNSGGTVVSYTLTLKNGATSPPGTSVTLTPPASGATTTNYVYTYFANGDPMPVTGSSITITNVSGSTIVRFKIDDAYGAISDTSGLSVAMGQTYTFSLPRDLTPNTYNFSIFAYYGGGSPNELYQVVSNNGLISITTFYGTFLNVGLSKFTIASYYYQYVLVGTNAGGSNTLTTSIIANIDPPFTSKSVTGLTMSGSTYNGNGTFNISVSWDALAGATRYYVTVTDNTNASINVSGNTASTSINLLMPVGAANHNSTIALYAVNASSQQSQTSTQVIFLTDIPI